MLGDRIQSMTPEVCVTAETAPTQGRAPLHLIAYGDSPPGTPAANAAKRLVAAEADLLGGKRSDLIPLGNALVANRLLTRGTGTLEVAHEALLRRPPLDGWLEQQKDALKLRDDVLREAKEWDGGRRQGARRQQRLS